MIELLDVASAAQVASKLEELAVKAGNIRGRGVSPGDRVRLYLLWVPEAIAQLQYALPVTEIDKLVATQRYWAVLSMSNYGAEAWALTDVELQARQNELTAQSKSISDELTSWGGGTSQLAVLDTNILMHQIDKLDQFNWNKVLTIFSAIPVILVIPMMVVDELDGLKDRGEKDQRALARKALGAIESWFPGNETTYRLRARTINIVDPDSEQSTPDLRIFHDPLRHVRLSTADAEIVARAISLKPFAAQVTVVTNDTNMLTRAHGAKLAATRPRGV